MIYSTNLWLLNRQIKYKLYLVEYSNKIELQPRTSVVYLPVPSDSGLELDNRHLTVWGNYLKIYMFFQSELNWFNTRDNVLNYYYYISVNETKDALLVNLITVVPKPG